MKRPSLMKSVLLLFLIDMALRAHGFARVNRWLMGIKATSQSSDQVQPVLMEVLRATALYPGRSLCLEQSIATSALLRRRGVDARVRMAVQHYPFAAHAWVEIGGQPVTESPEVVSRFTLLPEAVA